MQIVCPHCNQLLELPGERPKFCAYCGQALPAPQPVATADLHDEAATLPPTDDARVPPTLATTLLPADAGCGDAAPVPRTVGGYRLLRQLGRGGMGSVYEAEDGSTGRRVALKLIAPQFADSPDAIARFRQEGPLAGLIAHPRCVFVLAADEEAGRPYIVMELMPGSTLQDLVQRQGRLSPDQAVARILDVIEGLEEAHQRGVIHRDVKPSNCFLDAEGRVKIGDFGLAKSLVRNVHLTQTGSFLGTPLFSSPEQVRGECVDQQCDVYAVAATLYYLLAGQAPFQSGDLAVTLARIAADPPPSLRSLRPELSPSLDRVVLRGLERTRERRWRNLEEFREALLPFLPGKLSIGGMGIRFGAYLIDLALLTLVGLGIGLGRLASGSFDPFDQSFLQPYTAQNVTWQLLGLIFWLLYFPVPEGIWGCSVGKWLLRLRVWGVADSAPPGLGRALLRTAVFALLINLGTLAFWLIRPTVYLPQAVEPEQWLQQTVWNMTVSMITPAGMAVGVLLLLAPMRARNGYRGLHDFVSGTRVVRLPPREPHQAIPSRALDQNLGQPDGLPKRVGPFAIRGALRWSDGAKTLLGEDEALGRKVLVWLHSSEDVPLDPARRELARPGRLRWLAGSQPGEMRWDAFQAPTGGPLADLVSREGPLAWPDLGPLLEQLTAELVAACADNTLPRVLSVEQVWVQATGQALLLDTPLRDPVPEPPAPRPEARLPGGIHAAPAALAEAKEGNPILEVEPVEPDDQERALTLLGQVGVVALEGRPRGAKADRRPVRTPLPGHAARLVNRLLGSRPGYKQLKLFETELRATRQQPTEVTRGKRAAHLALLAAFLAVGLCSCMFPLGWTFSLGAVFAASAEVKEMEKALHELDQGAACEYLRTQLHPSPVVRASGCLQWEQDRRLRSQLLESLDRARRVKERGLKALGWVQRRSIVQMEQYREQSEQMRAEQSRSWEPAGASLPFRTRAANLAQPPMTVVPESGFLVGLWLVAVVQLAFWPVAWVVWAFLTRGGFTLSLMGIALVRADGRPASRFQCAARALLVWAPVTLLLMLAASLDAWYLSREEAGDAYGWLPWASWAVWWSAPLLLLSYVILALRSPARSVHDRLVGTYLVPR